MKSSAKITFTFLAAAALGAAGIFTGCTVTSGTDNDTDAGTNAGDSSTGTSDTGTSTADTGTTPSACVSGLASSLGEGACLACLNDKCCDQQKACKNAGAADAGGKLDCDGYIDCYDECTTTKTTQAELDTCYAACDDEAVTPPAVKTAYEAIETCGDTNCQAACGGDGG